MRLPPMVMRVQLGHTTSVYVTLWRRLEGMSVDRAEGVRALDALLVWHCWVLSNALAQAAKFVSIVGCVLHIFVLWMAQQLLVFQGLAGELVKDGQGDWRG